MSAYLVISLLGLLIIVVFIKVTNPTKYED